MCLQFTHLKFQNQEFSLFVCHKKTKKFYIKAAPRSFDFKPRILLINVFLPTLEAPIIAI